MRHERKLREKGKMLNQLLAERMKTLDELENMLLRTNDDDDD